jgi:general secretion pathway protein M
MTDLLRRLSTREKALVIGAVLFVSAALLYGLVLDPLAARERRYRSMLLSKREDLAQFRKLAADYRAMESSLRDLEGMVSNRTTGTSLLAAMEAEARKLGLAEKITSMKPFSNVLDSGMVESSVDMRIEKVDLKGLVELLKGVENGGLLARTARLRVKTRFDDPQLLDATVLVTTLEAR